MVDDVPCEDEAVPMADKILTSAAFLGFVVLKLIPLWMVVIILLRDFIVTALRAYAGYKGKPFPTSYYSKWKTFLQMTFLYYLLLMYVGKISPENKKIFDMLLDGNLIYFVMLFITAITFHSGFTYLYKNRHLIAGLFSRED